MQKTKRADDARRQAKSRANRSDEKKEQVKETGAKQHARVRKVERNMTDYKRPTLDTKLWEIPGKDFTLDRHTEDATTAQMLFHMNSSNFSELESTYLVAYCHVVNRFLGRINDPSKLKIDDEKERADCVARVEEGLYYLNDLYTMSIEENITFLRLIGEVFEGASYTVQMQSMEWERKASRLIHRDECLMEWLVLSDEGVKLVQEFKDDKRLEERSLQPFIWNRGDVSITEPDKSIADNFPQCLVERLQQILHRHLEIHGFDVRWMISIIGLRLSIPEWWWEDTSGNRYSKRSKLWTGEIVDVSLPGYMLGLYQDQNKDGHGYFMFKCDKEDDNEYRMKYSDVLKFADENQSESFLLPKEIPEKYVDKKLHFFCDITRKALFKLDWAHKCCTRLHRSRPASL